MKNKINITNKERWRVALHEAGHVILGQHLAGTLHRPAARAAVFNAGGGCARVTGMRAIPLMFRYAVLKNVNNCLQTESPTTESQARPLAKLPPAQQPEAWTAANEKAESEGRKVMHVQPL